MAGLVTIETGMKLRLSRDAQVSDVPEQVCDGCLKVLTKMISKGAALRNDLIAKEQNRLNMWKSRVQMVKQAKAFLAQKNYSDAAIAYEKYLRILELVYELDPGELSPDLFKNQARAPEMTVIATVYWDLLRVYDTHQTYRERQMKAASKLAEFVRFTPIFPHVIRKAESYARTAKNPDAFRKFLQLSNANRPRCFIATAAFDHKPSSVVSDLCRFRDQYLLRSTHGQAFVELYYRVSPPIAVYLDRHPAWKPHIRAALTRIASSRFVKNRLNP